MTLNVSVGVSLDEPVLGRAEDATRALQEIDELLSVRWMPFARPMDSTSPGRYALVCRWPSHDPRWEMYRSGELGEPFDILGVFEVLPGSRDAGFKYTDQDSPEALLEPEALLDQAQVLLGKCDNRRHGWRTRVRNAFDANKALREKRKADLVDEAVHRVKEERPRLGKGGKMRRHVPGSDIVDNQDLEVQDG